MRVRSFLAPSLGLALVLASASPRAQTPPDLSGTWVFADAPRDAHTVEAVQPALGREFTARQDRTSLVIERAHGDDRIEYTYALDGSETETRLGDSVITSRARWQDGALVIATKSATRGDDGKTVVSESTRRLRLEADALVVETEVTAPQPAPLVTSVYKRRAAEAASHVKAAPARLAALSWLAGNWSGQAGRATLEERWTRAAGGAMLAVSRTVIGEQMVAFEYLRIVERDGGLVYIAQPDGAAPTEFVLTELSPTRAVFDNPRHDYPKRIVYELSAEGGLSATIGFTKGGSPRRFQFKREGS